MGKTFYFACIIFLSIACSNDNNKSSDPAEIPNKEEEPIYIYKYDSNSTELKWTAFKHLNKVPVGGKFESFTVKGFEPSSKISDALQNVSFSINTASTNTQDKDRDLKIVANFFGNMLDPSGIKGKIKKIEGDESGTGTVLIKMNGVEKLTPFEWKVDQDNQFILTTKINVLDWKLDQALGILNTVCLEKHTDSKGGNKLWPDVEVIVFTYLIKE